ncbi:hypothetical protein J1N35_005571 [Gossypium stocksii]|uniref:Transposase MuDR plant domain-containing protein n=1 Tax=Gossypium stocksii TaxID=47602 RepID=A0A9D3WE29_9ROSI|nr:hypothetical protein J1N35_005571 [Gossypium stocksii]
MVNRREAANVVTSIVTGLIDNNFNGSKEEMSDFYVSVSDVSNRIRVNLNGLNMDDIEVGELCDSDDSGKLNSAHKSESDGQNWSEFNPDNDISNPKLQVGMLLKSKDSLKEVVRQYGRLNSYFIRLPKNDLNRLKAVCSSKCSWYIWASRLNPNDPTD